MYVWGRWWVGWWFKLNYIHQPGPANTAWSLQTSGSLIELSTASIQRGAGRKEEKISCHWISEIFPKTCTFLLPAAATTCGILLRGPINSHGVAEEERRTLEHNKDSRWMGFWHARFLGIGNRQRCWMAADGWGGRFWCPWCGGGCCGWQLLAEFKYFYSSL